MPAGRLLYNENITSAGRIRFTKAHELGHYLLHREKQTEFRCTQGDMLHWSGDANVEMQADEFASHLLMPLTHFREGLPTAQSTSISWATRATPSVCHSLPPLCAG